MRAVPRPLLVQLTPTRFAASVVVVLFHFGGSIPALAGPWASALLRDGPLAVTWFFTLSGFVMASVHGDLQGRGAAVRYWRNRFARIYPVYVIALALEGAALGLSPLLEPAAWLLSATLMQAWVPGFAGALNSPGWSLSVEAFFYAVFPFLIVRATRLGPWAWCGVAALCWAITQALFMVGVNQGPIPFPSRMHDLLHYFPLLHLNSFLIGMAGAELVRRYRPGRGAGAALTLLGVALSLLVVTSGHDVAAGHGFWLSFDSGLLAPVFALTLCGLATADLPVLRWPSVILLGEASYAFYILQFPAYTAWIRFVRPRFSLSAEVELALFLVCLLAIAIATHVLIETPCRRWLRASSPAGL